MPSGDWSLGASRPGEAGQTGPCDEEAARRARDTVCPVPPPPPSACRSPGPGKQGCLLGGGLLSCPGLWKGPGAPAGCREVMGLVSTAFFPRVLFQQGSSSRWCGGGGGDALGLQALGLSDDFVAFVLLPAPHCPSAKTWTLLQGLPSLPPLAHTWDTGPGASRHQVASPGETSKHGMGSM